jgi:hypothetical protein
MFRHFTHHNTSSYVHILQKLVDSYNSSYHRTIKMPPKQVDASNGEIVWRNIYRRSEESVAKKPKFAVGDKVRISKYKRLFKKGYLPNWTTELFIVAEVVRGDIPVYHIRDYSGELLRGSFYEQELQKVQDDGVYKIEKILDTRGEGKSTSQLVKWLGYPDSFNSWVLKKDVIKYKN